MNANAVRALCAQVRLQLDHLEELADQPESALTDPLHHGRVLATLAKCNLELAVLLAHPVGPLGVPCPNEPGDITF